MSWRKFEIIRIIGRYYDGDEYEKIIEVMMDISRVLSDKKIKPPLLKVTLVRVCSMLGIPRMSDDGRGRESIIRGEDILFGKVYPILGYEPYWCKHFSRWVYLRNESRKWLEELDLEKKIAK
ncbi:Hypothetical predicted protein, partial [Paramuricea clavata]